MLVLMTAQGCPMVWPHIANGGSGALTYVIRVQASAIVPFAAAALQRERERERERGAEEEEEREDKRMTRGHGNARQRDDARV